MKQFGVGLSVGVALAALTVLLVTGAQNETAGAPAPAKKPPPRRPRKDSMNL